MRTAPALTTSVPGSMHATFNHPRHPPTFTRHLPGKTTRPSPQADHPRRVRVAAWGRRGRRDEEEAAAVVEEGLAANEEWTRGEEDDVEDDEDVHPWEAHASWEAGRTFEDGDAAGAERAAVAVATSADVDVRGESAARVSGAARHPLGTPSAPSVPYAATTSPSPLPPAGKPLTGWRDAVVNVGIVSTAIVAGLVVKKGVDLFNSIPDMRTEERLIRSDDFITAQLARVAEMDPSPRRDKELERLEKLRADIRRQRKTFEAAEARRAEWNARLKRLDADGNPVGSLRDRSRRATGGSGSGAGAKEDDTHPEDNRPPLSVGEEERRRRLEQVARDARARAKEAEVKAAPPGAGSRWVKAADYLQSAVEKTATGYSDEEGLAPDAPPSKDTEVRGPPPPPTPPAREPEKPGGKPWTPTASSSSASSSSPTSRPERETDAADRREGGGDADEPKPETKAPPAASEPALATKKATEKVRSSEKKGMKGVTAPLKAFASKVKKSVSGGGDKGGGRDVFEAEIVDNRDDLTDIPGLTPQQELDIAADIRRLEQMYGDDPNVTAEELDRRANEIIEKYGLDAKGFTENEMWSPDEDTDVGERHYSQDDPFYWRKCRVVWPIFDAQPKTQMNGLMTMMMTHPGLPAYLPGGKKPEDKDHAVAFEDKEDAERFVWFMRSTRRDQGEGIMVTRAMPPQALESLATEMGFGVTVVATGRVDLKPGRSDMAVLQDIREIGGEQYLWEFAQFTKNELEERRKPPPPTISY